MAFPDTRLTLIHRLAAGGSQQDWQDFLVDYWGPICRFASLRASITQTDAEDVAAKTFEVVLGNKLLARWTNTRAAKLRTLICSVVNNVLSNQVRVAQNRKRILEEYVSSNEKDGPLIVSDSPDVPDEQVDAFYVAWVEELLRHAVDGLLRELHEEGKGDCFRVLYGRLCERMSIPEICESLDIQKTTAENHFKRAKKRLADRLKKDVLSHVRRYSNEPDVKPEFHEEWGQLAEHLRKCGGFEDAVRQVYLNSAHMSNLGRPSEVFQRTLKEVAESSADAKKM